MRHYSSLADRTNTHLPLHHAEGHELCFKAHDIMLQMLISGQEARIFHKAFTFRDAADRHAFEAADDVFVWLEETRRVDERADLLATIVFPKVLSDMLHCVYEALECSRKAKLAIAYMLLRKPLQESLFLLESVVADRMGFAEKMVIDPVQLHSQGAGGVDVHAKRIQAVLDKIGNRDGFDARYLAQLRYDKKAADGFDGICNQAMHLFTNHEAIRTEKLNINFIFSEWDAIATQWSFLYSRLPYVLVYTYHVVEHVCGSIARTTPAYLDDMDRRIAGLVVLWGDTLKAPYDEARLSRFIESTREWLQAHCKKAGYREPNAADLARMGDTGAYPGETDASVAARCGHFEEFARANKERSA